MGRLIAINLIGSDGTSVPLVLAATFLGPIGAFTFATRLGLFFARSRREIGRCYSTKLFWECPVRFRFPPVKVSPMGVLLKGAKPVNAARRKSRDKPRTSHKAFELGKTGRLTQKQNASG